MKVTDGGKTLTMHVKPGIYFTPDPAFGGKPRELVAEDYVYALKRHASPRLEAIIFGAGDFSASQGARVDTNFDAVVDYPGDMWHYARSRIVVAARAAGIDAIDATTTSTGKRDRRASCCGNSRPSSCT